MDFHAAIVGRKIIEFDYEGYHRVVIPAAIGRHASTGNRVLRGYQLAGTSRTQKIPCWDLFLVGKISNLVVSSGRFSENPPGYKKGDRHIVPIECEL